MSVGQSDSSNRMRSGQSGKEEENNQTPSKRGTILPRQKGCFLVSMLDVTSLVLLDQRDMDPSRLNNTDLIQIPNRVREKDFR